MVSPARVEGYLTLQPEIGQAMVFGDRRPYLVAVIVPKPEFAEAFVQRQDDDATNMDLAHDPEFNKLIAAAVSRVNANLAPVERVRRFTIAAEPFTVANGQMTPTLKIKRFAIRQVYGAALQALYEANR
jgi:long-chain acyl-CoA synthetase